MNTDFHKIRRLPPYVFEQVNRTKASLRAQGADIIDRKKKKNIKDQIKVKNSLGNWNYKKGK